MGLIQKNKHTDARARGERAAKDREIQRLRRLVEVESVLWGRLLGKKTGQRVGLKLICQARMKLILPRPHSLGMEMASLASRLISGSLAHS